MIITAETFSSVCWLPVSHEPMPVAVRPRRMKIAEKVPTKIRLGTSTRLVSASSMSAGVTPAMALR